MMSSSTRTHDNDTTAGWYSTLTDEERARALGTLQCTDDAAAVCDAMVFSALSSPARLAILPAQDILRLGCEGRMNTPGEGAGQWNWRLDIPLTADSAPRLAALVAETGRTGS